MPQTAGQGGAGGGRGPWETRWDHSSRQKKFGGEEARAELSLFLSSPTFLSAAPPCNGGGGGGAVKCGRRLRPGQLCGYGLCAGGPRACRASLGL